MVLSDEASQGGTRTKGTKDEALTKPRPSVPRFSKLAELTVGLELGV